jgi:hypothetical protein
MPLRREASRCPKAITRQSYYESRISGIPDVLSSSREYVYRLIPGKAYILPIDISEYESNQSEPQQWPWSARFDTAQAW